MASRRAEMMSMILTEPVSRARALNSSSSPLRTARSRSCRSTICRPFLDLLLVDAGTVPPQQELADIGRHRVLPGELPHQVLADDVPVEGVGARSGPGRSSSIGHHPPTVSGSSRRQFPTASSRTRFVAVPIAACRPTTTTAADAVLPHRLGASTSEDVGSVELISEIDQCSRRNRRSP